jgi:hypothetical protein
MCVDARCRRLHPLSAHWTGRGWVAVWELIERDSPPPPDSSKVEPVTADGTYWIEAKFMPSRSELQATQRAARKLAERGLVEVEGGMVRLAVSEEQREAERQADLVAMGKIVSTIAGV